MTELKFIEVRGAREHNLQSVDVNIPRDKLVVITGLSGSGKSSLPLIRYMQKARGGTLKAFQRMPDSFST